MPQREMHPRRCVLRRTRRWPTPAVQPLRLFQKRIPCHVRLRLPSPHSATWVLAETGTSALFSLFSMLLISRVIGPEASGTGAVAIAAFLLMDLFCASLFTDALVQRLLLARRHAHSAVTVQVLVGCLAALLLVLLAPHLAAGAEAPEVQPLCWALAPLLPLSAFSGSSAGLVLRQRRYRLLALRAIIGLPLALIAGLLTAHAGWGAFAMVAQQAGATVVTFLLLLGLGGFRLRPRVSRRALAELWPVAGPQIMAVMVQAGRYRLFVLALGMVASEAVVAVCNIAFRLLDAALGVVWGSVSRLSLPRLSALQHDRLALAEAYGDLAQLQALLGMPIAAGVALTAPDLVRALMGPAWAEAADAARVVGAMAVLSFCWGDAGSLFVALGKTRRNLAISCITLAVPVIALLVVKPETAVGVAACWSATVLASAPLLTTLVLQELGRSPFWLLRRIAPALLATGCMVVTVLLLQRETRLPPLASLLLCATAGAAVFGLVAWLALGRRRPAGLRVVPAQ